MTARRPLPDPPSTAPRKYLCATARSVVWRSEMLFFQRTGSANLAQWPEPCANTRPPHPGSFMRCLASRGRFRADRQSTILRAGPRRDVRGRRRIRHQRPPPRVPADDRGRDGHPRRSAADHRPSHVRRRSGTYEGPQPKGDTTAGRRRFHPSYRPDPLRQVRRGHDHPHRQGRALSLLYLLDQGAAGVRQPARA